MGAVCRANVSRHAADVAPFVANSSRSYSTRRLIAQLLWLCTVHLLDDVAAGEFNT